MIAAFGGTRTALIVAAGDDVPPGIAREFEASIARRAAREPLQHITGSTGFYGLEFKTDRRALVPRADSECVVEAALEFLGETEAAHIADLGTGSGCLLAAVLSARARATGEGVEADADAATLARENIAALGLAARARIIETEWSAWTGWGSASLILSNPPYIASSVIATLAPEVRDHDPRLALDGGPDGLGAYRQIIALAQRGMARAAPLVLEIGHDQREAVLALLDAAGFTDTGSAKDLGGQDRCVWGLAPGAAH
jgi:release factor glutamine methyltransferase